MGGLLCLVQQGGDGGTPAHPDILYCSALWPTYWPVVARTTSYKNFLNICQGC